MSTALVGLVYLLNPERAGAGVMGGPASDCAPSTPVNVSGDDLSTIDILNSMVKQVPGVTWLVLYDDGGDTDWIGYMCGDGRHMRVSVTFR